MLASRFPAYSSFVTSSIPAALFSLSRLKHSSSSSSFIRWYKLVNLNFPSLRAFAAMRSSFVPTVSPLLCAASVSLLCSTICRLLPSGGITRLHWYY